jgi:hypothetical protein
VALRLLTYISRPAVYKAGGSRIRALATVACQIINLLLAHGTVIMGHDSLDTPQGASDIALVGSLQGVAKDYIILCYEVSQNCAFFISHLFICYYFSRLAGLEDLTKSLSGCLIWRHLSNRPTAMAVCKTVQCRTCKCQAAASMKLIVFALN